MRVSFTKMHGIGNDFVLVDATDGAPALSPEDVRRIADRRRGVGCDQVLVAEAARGAPVAMRIYNADGSAAEQCGNGLRCFARFVRERGLVTCDEFEIEVGGARVLVRFGRATEVLARLAAPGLEPAEVPLKAASRAPVYVLEVDGDPVEVGAVSMGNPHLVLLVADIDKAPVHRLGPALQRQPCLPCSANVGFMQVVDRDRIRLRVFERGVGETEACGSGACAAVVSGRVRGLLDEEVSVELPGGTLMIRWKGEGEPVWMSGPTSKVFEGELEL
jgi:diaminopimelate epimerase